MSSSKSNVTVLALLIVVLVGAAVFFLFQFLQGRAGAFVVRSQDGSAELSVPAGALPKGVKPSDLRILPEQSEAAVSMYRLEPDGLRLAVPATLTLTVKPDPLDDSVSLPTLVLRDGNGEHPEPLTDTKVILARDGKSLTVSAPISHFSLVTRADGFFEVSIPKDVRYHVGETFNYPFVVRYARKVQYRIKLADQQIIDEEVLLEDPSVSGVYHAAMPVYPTDYVDAPPTTKLTGGPDGGSFIYSKPFTCNDGGTGYFTVSPIFVYSYSFNGSGKHSGITSMQVHADGECQLPQIDGVSVRTTCNAEAELSGKVIRFKEDVTSFAVVLISKKTKEITTAKGTYDPVTGRFSIPADVLPSDTYEYVIWIKVKNLPDAEYKVWSGEFDTLPCSGGYDGSLPPEQEEGAGESGGSEGGTLTPGSDDSTPAEDATGQPKKTVQALDLGGRYVTLDQVHTGQGPECSGPHYHANSASAIATDGSKVFDPGGCGFGIVGQVPIVDVEVDE